MAKNDLLPQIYGYAICLVSVLAFMFAFPTSIGGYMKYVNPSLADGAPQILSTSYERWRTDFLKKLATPVVQPDSSVVLIFGAEPPPESRLQVIYEESKGQHLKTFKLHLLVSLVKQVIVWIISIISFAYHWKWLRKRNHSTASPSAST